MIRASTLLLAFATVAVPTLGACASASGGDVGYGSYALGRGLVSYDALRRAGEDCKEKGGVVRPKDEGGDPAMLNNYLCVIPKKASHP